MSSWTQQLQDGIAAVWSGEPGGFRYAIAAETNRGEGRTTARTVRRTQAALETVEPPIFYRTAMGPPVSISVAEWVVDSIAAEFGRVNGFAYRGCEVAGYLLGHGNHIDYAIAAGSDHRETSVRLDHPLTVPGNDRILGDWHVENGTHVMPSDSDLRSSCWSLFNSGLELGRQLDSWYSIIASRAEFGWHLHGYVTRPWAGSHDRSKTEPCAIEWV